MEVLFRECVASDGGSIIQLCRNVMHVENINLLVSKSSFYRISLEETHFLFGETAALAFGRLKQNVFSSIAGACIGLILGAGGQQSVELASWFSEKYIW